MERKCTLVIKDFSGNIIFQKECLCKKQALQELKEYWDNAGSNYFHWDIVQNEK